MLELKVFDGTKDVVLQFEHSLLSLSKWEEIHKKPFLAKRNHAATEMIDYFVCMLMSPEEDPTVVYGLSPEQLEELVTYINTDRTASTVPEDTSKKPSGQTVTSELLYSWLVSLKIPFQPTETWHLSRTMMLIQMVTINNTPPKKLNKAEAVSRWKELNAKNRERFKSKG